MTPWILAAKLLASAAGTYFVDGALAPATGDDASAPATSSSTPGSTPAIAPKKAPRAAPAAATEEPRTPAPRGEPRAAATPEIEIGIWPDDASRLPRLEPPGVVRGPAPGRSPLLGWSGALAEPEFVDRTHRVPWVPRPADFGATMRPGERFKFDVYFGGNPTGIAEAAVVAREPGPNGTPDRIRLEGSARTSGVAALLTTIVYDMAAILDAETGAPVMTGAITKREGMATTYKRRETVATFFGRGFVEIADDKDGKTSSARKRLPADTFDPLSVMAWVRSLDLEPGAKAKAHALDGNTLLRVDITARGPTRTNDLPPLAAALGITQDQVVAYDGVITRVDRFGAAIPGKKAYKMRVWVSSEGRRIPLMIESDLWLGVVRLILTQYDPPHDAAGSRTPAPRAG
ncbi:MAG TPA: DUF3108 domain-containing protein [Nannocystis sp.]|jgi:hypothetical protein